MFFDIGANIGKWSLANAPLCNKIIAVEASPQTFNNLKNSCKDEKITLLNYAVCNNNGEDITFYQANYDTLSTLNKEWLTDKSSRFYGEKYTEIKCKTITIDELIKQYGSPSLIKIDVEGGEYMCISSLTKKVDLLCFEWASETSEIAFNSLDYLLKLGFTNFFIQNGDDYTFRPKEDEYYDINETKLKFSQTVPKRDWGMIWCK